MPSESSRLRAPGEPQAGRVQVPRRSDLRAAPQYGKRALTYASALGPRVVRQLQRAIGNQAVGHLLAARATQEMRGTGLHAARSDRESWPGDDATARPERAPTLQRKLTKGDKWEAGWGPTGYWSDEQVHAEFVKLADAHGQLKTKIGNARLVMPVKVSDEVKSFDTVEAVWKKWDGPVNWADRKTCLSELNEALQQIKTLHSLLQQQKVSEEEAADNQLEEEQQREKLKTEKRQAQVVKQVEQPHVGKQPPSPSSGKNQKQTVGTSDETPKVETVAIEEQPKKSQPVKQQAVKQPKLTAAEKKERRKQKEREEREEQGHLKREADQKAELEAKKIQADNAIRIQKVLGDADSRELKLKLRGLTNLLSEMQSAKKPSWQSIVVEARKLPDAIEEAEKRITKFDEDQEKAFESGWKALEPKLDRARADAPARKIPLTKLEASVKGVTDLQQTKPPDWFLLNKTLAGAKAEADAVLGFLDAAEEYDKDKAQVLARLEEARKLKTRAIDQKSLESALKWMEGRETRHQELLLADEPDWQQVRSALSSLDRAITTAFRSVIKDQSKTAVSGDGQENEQAAVDLALEALAGEGTWEQEVKAQGGKWGAHYSNFSGYLPVGSYDEYYVKPPEGVKGPGARRLVVDDKGRIFYTWNHYGENAGPNDAAYVHLT